MNAKNGIAVDFRGDCFQFDSDTESDCHHGSPRAKSAQALDSFPGE